MSITDELREAINELRVECEEKEGCGVLWYPEPTRDRFSAIADRIDEKHESVCCEIADKFDGWVVPPKDADGETIHLQDRMVWDNGTFNVHELNLTADGWTTWDEMHGYTVRADQCRHYHEQTVEDVLREFAQKMNENIGMYMGEAIDADEWRDADAKNIAEYAAKLRLAGGE